ncbi:MAG: plasmid mobilization relaxosome protein MobC [Coriobacteriales bacterium]|nr:plasmid mobilization relaxosome protein MobC [Coriobacteriales bacterium]
MMKACRPKQNRPPDWFKFHRELCAIGNSLNQIAHIAHITGNIDAEKLDRFRKDFEEVLIALVAEMYEPEQLDATRIIREAKAKAKASQRE